jgi:hypothetical protein
MGVGVDGLNRIFQMGRGDGIVDRVLGRARGVGMDVFGSNFGPMEGIRGWIMRRAE